jgi:hypothetical protein
MAKLRAQFLPGEVETKTTTCPSFGQTSNASGARKFLGFDAAADEAAYWTFFAPEDLTGTLEVRIWYGMVSATSGNTIWEATLECITSGDATDLDTSESLGTVNTAAANAVPGTAGYAKSLAITMTNTDSIAAGDMCRMRIRRMGSSGSDTATGDAMFFGGTLVDAA